MKLNDSRDGEPRTMPDIDLPDVVAEVRAVFDRYEAALLANDIAVPDTLFWDDPRVVRYGVGENLYGHEDIAAFRRARSTGPFSPTLAQRPYPYVRSPLRHRQRRIPPRGPRHARPREQDPRSHAGRMAYCCRPCEPVRRNGLVPQPPRFGLPVVRSTT